jgi:hypothetical protein
VSVAAHGVAVAAIRIARVVFFVVLIVLMPMVPVLGHITSLSLPGAIVIGFVVSVAFLWCPYF